MLDRWGKSDPQVLEEAIEALKNESEHMKELIEQLLFLARGDSGRQNLNVVEMDLNEIVTEVYDESLMIDPDHEYKLVVNEMQPCNFTGDIAMVKQSKRILVQNAAKYSGKGDTIKLSAKKETNGVSYIVQDEGIGMTESDVSHIFERFYRSDVARNSESGGSGLGLSIAKWIVDAHRGSIDVLSREDFGTRFTVHFPNNLK
jgi:signal transduction histidine kinase